MTTCAVCASDRHCAEHCPTCRVAYEANRAQLELFERYLGARQPTHTREWNAQA